MAKIFSVDIELDRLYGEKTFAAGAVVWVDGQTVAEFSGRCPTPKRISPWVRKNVLPAVSTMPITHDSPKELEEALWKFWRAHHEGARAVAFFGSMVEAGLFARCIRRDYKTRLYQGPHPLHEVGTFLLQRGENIPSSLADVIVPHRINVDHPASPHHPLYDAHAAAAIAEHFLKTR